MKLNKAHVLLATRSHLSDGAILTLMEIMLQVDVFGEVPSLTELSRYRGCVRSVIQSHISELITCGVIIDNKLIDIKEGYGKRLSVSQDALARANGFKSFAEVDYKKYAGVKSGNMKKDSKASPALASQPETINTPGKLLKYFSLKHQEYFNKPYESTNGDLTFFKNLIKSVGKSQAVNYVDAFFANRHFFRVSATPKSLYSVRGKLKGKL